MTAEQQQQARFIILATALGEIGQAEIVGSQHNPRILEYFRTVGHAWVDNDETAWCAAAVGWVLQVNGYHSTRSLAARSYLEYGVQTVEPAPGDLAVFWRGNNNPGNPFGHVAFYLGRFAGQIYVLGGNQSNQWNVTTYDQRRLLQYRAFIF